MIGVWVYMMSLHMPHPSYANDDFQAIPEGDPGVFGEEVQELWKPSTDSFRDTYNQSADRLSWNCGDQLASGIMHWDTLLCLLKSVVSFISNMALVVWAAMVIYAWYLYVVSVFAGDQTGKAQDAIKYAALGIVIVIFAYAILNFVVESFL